MKIAKAIIWGMLSLCGGLGAFCLTNGKDTIFAIGPVTEMIIEAVCLTLLPVLLLILCILGLVEKFRRGDTKKGALIAGTVLFALAAALGVSTSIRSRDSYKLIKTLESPDGEHQVYYYETELEYTFNGRVTDGCCTLCRTGLFMYKKDTVFSMDATEDIEWEEDCYSLYGHKYGYSAYN